MAQASQATSRRFDELAHTVCDPDFGIIEGRQVDGLLLAQRLLGRCCRIGRLGRHVVGQRLAFDQVALDATAVPVPGAIWLLGSGLVCLVGFRKKFKN